MNNILRILVLLAISGTTSAFGQMSITAINTTVKVDFDTTLSGVTNGQFGGSGFQSTPTAGQLDSDAWAVTGWSDGALAFAGTRTTAGTDYTRGLASGAVTTGGIYAIGSTDRQLMIQPGGSDWAPGTLTLRIQNNTGVPISRFDFSFERYIRNDQGRGNSFNFSYSTDNISYSTAGLPVNAAYTSVAATDASPSWTLQATVSGSISITSPVVNGGFFYVRWSGADVDGSGSRDEFGLDDISITAIPEPSSFAALLGSLALTGVVGLRRRRRF